MEWIRRYRMLIGMHAAVLREEGPMIAVIGRAIDSHSTENHSCGARVRRIDREHLLVIRPREVGWTVTIDGRGRQRREGRRDWNEVVPSIRSAEESEKLDAVG